MKYSAHVQGKACPMNDTSSLIANTIMRRYETGRNKEEIIDCGN
jgi:hypothetical protein